MPAVVTLTTDFGVGSPYVAAMKGVLLAAHPALSIVDITHAIEPQNVRQAAQVLADVSRFFPAHTIHLAVVDPGVGTARGLIYARFGVQQFLAPDNGLLSRLAAEAPPSTIIRLTEPQYWAERVAPTFHGRDILAPVAGRLSLGLDPELLGPRQLSLQMLDWPEAQRMAGKIEGEIVAVDSFGNLISNITEAQLRGVPTGEELQVLCDEHETRGLFRTYGDQPPQTFLALVGSNGCLELAIVNESAALMLGLGVGAKVTLKW